jgi:hypothetical protein
LMENELLPVRHDGVPGVAATLVSSHDVDLFGQDVHHLGFALVAPLGADNDQVFLKAESGLILIGL